MHIHCGSDRQWERMARLMGREDLLADPRFATVLSRGEHKEQVDDAVRAWTSGLDKMAAMRALGEAGVPAGALRSTTEVLTDGDLRERGIFVTVDDPGRGEVTIPGYPVRMSRSPVAGDGAAPAGPAYRGSDQGLARRGRPRTWLAPRAPPARRPGPPGETP